MKIVVITGSPHRAGTSALLADRFIQGAVEAGHEVFRFDAAFKHIHPCAACGTCRSTKGGCVFQDSMEELNPHLLQADAVVFAAPIYYYGLCAQLKLVIDRFYANSPALHADKKTALLLTCEDDTMESAEGAVVTYRGIAGFLGWSIAGLIVAKDCLTIEQIRRTDYPEQAYALGKAF